MHVTKNSLARAVAALAILSLAACSGSGTNPANPTRQPIQASILQFSVGTANLYGTGSGLNVVVTYRQPSDGLHPGDSAVAVSSPTLTVGSGLPGSAGAPDGFFSTIASGPAPTELGTHNLTSTGQAQSTPTTFGRSGGAFALGIEPFNYNEGGEPDNIVPYAVPLYDPNPSSDTNSFIPWGGPPAFDPGGDGQGTRDGKSFPTIGSGAQVTLGISEGLDVFDQIAPVVGPYTLGIAVPADTGTVTTTKTAALGSVGLLPTLTAPIATLDGNGGASFTVKLAAGVTEGYIQVVDLGPLSASGSGLSCHHNGPASQFPNATDLPVYYTMVVRPGHLGGTIGDASGPLGTPSICTAAQNTTANGGTATPGDTFQVTLLGFDYPLYEATPFINNAPQPAINGGAGQSDVTISAASFQMEGSTSSGIGTGGLAKVIRSAGIRTPAMLKALHRLH
jgi:hypothetical protein